MLQVVVQGPPVKVVTIAEVLVEVADLEMVGASMLVLPRLRLLVEPASRWRGLLHHAEVD